MSNPTNKLPIPPRDELAARYAELRSHRLLGLEYGWSESTARTKCLALGIPSLPRGPHQQRDDHPWKAGIRGVVWGKGRAA